MILKMSTTIDHPITSNFFLQKKKLFVNFFRPKQLVCGHSLVFFVGQNIELLNLSNPFEFGLIYLLYRSCKLAFFLLPSGS